MLRAGIMLFHNNAHHHAALRTQLLQQFRWEVLARFIYSPDLAPRDYQLCQHLKRFLGGLHFPSDDAPLFGESFLRCRYREIGSRYDMCFSSGGSYVER
ncbi:hypothetical protein AVEN_19442-1 [Araneus ventricosus]|uniref:Histone-lysine N-methyltransferase SETMAR n=1 Tax=Araneus ventricosus TaxID=182803 RepID=A0A4Y2C710_ARAVE|nr:hypothetical protein AVEN_19442-1 [Araneus ventricosus]